MTNISKLSDAEVLQLAGGFGPAIIGEELYARAKEVRERTDNGRFGPALIDPDYGLDISPWDEFSRRDLLAIAREHDLPNVKPNASRDDIAKALMRAKLVPEPDDDEEDGKEGNPSGPTGAEGEE